MVRLSVLSALAGAMGFANAVDVFAHFMVTNSYAYDVEQWKADMKSARQMGINGFSLNWSPPNCDGDLTWFVDRIRDAYTAAEEMTNEGKNFKLYHSFDMDNAECNTFFTKEYMQDIIAEHAGNKATYRWNSNVLVSLGELLHVTIGQWLTCVLFVIGDDIRRRYCRSVWQQSLSGSQR